MVIIDFITGIWKAIKTKEKVTSKKLGNTIEKMVLYMIGIIASYVLQDHIGVEIIKLTWVFVTLIITREYLSIIENIEILTGTKLLFVIKKYILKIIPDETHVKPVKKK